MDNIRQYLLTVTAAALICGIVTVFRSKQGTFNAVLKLCTSLFLVLSVISPWLNVRILDFKTYAEGITQDAQSAVNDGEIFAQQQMSTIIKEQAETYILDKATSMGLKLEVEVKLDSSDPPLPMAVTVTGPVSPYTKARLSQCITDDLGIPKEKQEWI